MVLPEQQAGDCSDQVAGGLHIGLAGAAQIR